MVMMPYIPVVMQDKMVMMHHNADETKGNGMLQFKTDVSPSHDGGAQPVECTLCCTHHT